MSSEEDLLKITTSRERESCAISIAYCYFCTFFDVSVGSVSDNSQLIDWLVDCCHTRDGITVMFAH